MLCEGNTTARTLNLSFKSSQRSLRYTSGGTPASKRCRRRALIIIHRRWISLDTTLTPLSITWRRSRRSIHLKLLFFVMFDCIIALLFLFLSLILIIINVKINCKVVTVKMTLHHHWILIAVISVEVDEIKVLVLRK